MERKFICGDMDGIGWDRRLAESEMKRSEIEPGSSREHQKPDNSGKIKTFHLTTKFERRRMLALTKGQVRIARKQ